MEEIDNYLLDDISLSVSFEASSNATDCLFYVQSIQWNSRLHGSRGTRQGRCVRLQCRLVLVWLHDLQAPQRVNLRQNRSLNDVSCWNSRNLK